MTDRYFPPPGDAWAQQEPEQLGLNPALIEEAIALAADNEIDWSRDLAAELGLYAYGAGGNYIWIDQDRDLVAVVR